jgi:hypothetical protein
MCCLYSGQGYPCHASVELSCILRLLYISSRPSLLKIIGRAPLCQFDFPRKRGIPSVW